MNPNIKLYTSYFGKLSALKSVGIIPICIARGIPKFYNGPVLQSVAPYSWMLSDRVSREEYIDAYFNKVLVGVDPQKFLHQCSAISGGHDVALLCYEKPSDFCHRHLLAEWLESKTGIRVTEFGVSGEPWKVKKIKTEQLNLFDV